MLNAETIKKLFFQLNEKLKARNELAEVGLVGGAVMCLVFNTRASTRDVDAIFHPASVVRELASEVGQANGLSPHWLNDGAKGFLTEGFLKQEVLLLSHLRVWAPEAKYMLAMKCMSARFDTHDREDIVFLIGKLKLSNANNVFALIEKYYPKNNIPPKTKFFLEEVFESI